MKKKCEVEVEVHWNSNAGPLKDLLKTVPRDARVSVRTTPGDRPWESGQTFLKFTWTEEV